MSLCTVCMCLCLGNVFLYISGMSKDCLDALFNLVKKKAKKLNMWKGKAKTKASLKQCNQYLKVRQFIFYNTSQVILVY